TAGSIPGADNECWIVMEDSAGTATSIASPQARPASEILESLVARGAFAAALVYYHARPTERVIAQVLIADPPDSDVREAQIVRHPTGAVEVGPWERTV